MFKFNTSTRRTIVIEVGMQNAAQAIAIASSPFIFDNGVIAIPAIIYALMMNIILLTYVGSIKYKKNWNIIYIVEVKSDAIYMYSELSE